MKEHKLTEEEKLTDQLRNFTIEEVESYLEVLLTKSLEAIEKEDLATYGSIEKTLNQSLILFNGKVRNFNILYNKIKLKVANKFLKKYLKTNISLLEEVGSKGSFLTVEEAEKITEAEEYKIYLQAKANVIDRLKPTFIIDNDRYSYIGSKNLLIDNETNYSIEVWDISENVEILKAFITKDSALLTDKEQELLNKKPTAEAISKEEERIKNSKIVASEYGTVYYYNENDVFLVLFEDVNLDIYHKRTGTKVTLEVYNEKWFFIDFCNYCMGKVGTTIKELEEE